MSPVFVKYLFAVVHLHYKAFERHWQNHACPVFDSHLPHRYSRFYLEADSVDLRPPYSGCMPRRKHAEGGTPPHPTRASGKYTLGRSQGVTANAANPKETRSTGEHTIQTCNYPPRNMAQEIMVKEGELPRASRDWFLLTRRLGRDILQWYCRALVLTKPTMIQESFHLKGLETQLKSVIQRWKNSEALRTCKECGQVATLKY